MKTRLVLLSILPVLLFSCYACPDNWSDSPQTFTFTLDKYEAKAGDEITVDSGDVRVFDEDFKLCCEVYVEKDKPEWDEILVYVFAMTEKISSTRAVFEVPEEIISGKLIIRTDFWQKDDCSCDDGTWYSKGISDKPLTITQ